MVQSSLVRCFFTLSLGLLSVLILSRCSPEAPAPVEVVPAELLVTERVDSVIAAPASIDYSAVSSKGQGPSGTLIYAAPVFAPNGNFYAYTYDAQRRLTGTYERTSYGYDVIRVIRNEGTLLAEAYTGGVYPKQGAQTWSITRYRYDAQQRIALALTYNKYDDRYKLDQTVQYVYDGTGKLQYTRLTVAIATGHNQVTLHYWSDGDVYRIEQYNPGQPPVGSNVRMVYNQVENPLAKVHVWPQNLISRHYRTGYGPSEQGPAQELYQYRYEFDSQNRLTGYLTREFRTFENRWGDWTSGYTFSYAP
ncbi:hypothetical protein [Spirosoma pomorum]